MKTMNSSVDAKTLNKTLLSLFQTKCQNQIVLHVNFLNTCINFLKTEKLFKFFYEVNIAMHSLCDKAIIRRTN